MSIPLLPSPAIVLLLAAFAPLSASAQTAITGLASSVRDEVVRRCLPMQYREGADAYRDCVVAGVTAREGGTRGSAGLPDLTLDDRYAIERACAGADAARCMTDQIDALATAPDPYLDALDEDERYAIRRQCFTVQGEGGVVAYRQCLDDALVALDALPEPDLDSLSLLERNTLALRCSANDAGAPAADYRRCLLEATGSDPVVRAAPPARNTADTTDDAVAAVPDVTTVAETAPVPAVVPRTDPDPSRAPDASTAPLDLGDGTSNAEAATPVRRLVLPAAARPDEETNRAPPADGDVVITPQSEADIELVDTTSGLESGGTPDLGERVADVRERLVTTVSAMDQTQRIVLAAALALPLLLLGIWAATRGRAGARAPLTEPRHPIRNPDLVGRVSPGFDGDHTFNGDDTASEHFLGDLDLDDLPPVSAAHEPSPMDPTEPDTGTALGSSPGSSPGSSRGPARAAMHRPSPAPANAEADIPADDTDSRGYAPVFVPRSSFGRRLLGEQSPLAREYATEFLIYWMAYGDERYEPEVRAALLHDGGVDGDPHELIKRHVLEEDTVAFADVVRSLQNGAREVQRVQILDLLMVLLISERAMTPAQNTLLHFLADAFGLGPSTLDQRHEEAFGTPMPALARTDLAAWWDRVESDLPPRWDARGIAELDERAQARFRLGLPLDGDLGESEIVEGFRRAARRCHPHRFDELGERERALAERQFVKFEDARDRLLGEGR